MYHPQKDIEKCCIYKKAAPSYHGNQKLDSKNLSSRREQNRMRYTVEQLESQNIEMKMSINQVQEENKIKRHA